MGLDIFLYKTKNRNNELDKVYYEDNKAFADKFNDRMKNYYLYNLKALSDNHDMVNYDKMYDKMLRFIKSNTQSTWIIQNLLNKPRSLNTIYEWYSNNKGLFILKHYKHFHKLYFLYEYLSNNIDNLTGAVKDDNGEIYAAWLSDDLINDLIKSITILLRDGYVNNYALIEDRNHLKYAKDSLFNILNTSKHDERYYIVFS